MIFFSTKQHIFTKFLIEQEQLSDRQPDRLKISNVFKGKCENAYKCKFNGGYAPLVYDIDPITHEYLINETEAKTVRKIFELYLNGHSLIDITIFLNQNGYKTKASKEFRKNSVYDILGSEKYAGCYVYNKGYKERKRKKRDNTIIIKDGIPAII